MTKEEIIKPENLVYKKPTLMNDNAMHYCPGCSHGVVHKLIAEVIEEMGMEDKDETHYGLNGSPTQVKRIFPPTANDHHEVWDGDGSDVADKLFHMITDMKFI